MELTREQGLLITTSLVLIAAVAGSFALQWASPVAIPMALALLVVYIVSPIVDTLQLQLNTPRWVAIVVALLVIAGGTTLLTLLVTSSVADMAQNGEVYREALELVAQQLQDWVDWLREITGLTLGDSEGLELSQLLLDVDLQAILSTVGVGATNLIGVLTAFVRNGVLVSLFAILIIAGRRPLQTSDGFWGEIDNNVQRYLGVKFLASAATGVITWLILWILGIPLNLVFGVLAFFLNFIPSVGSLIAMILPLPIAYLAHADQPVIWILAFALPGSVQFLIGNVIEPRLQGDRLDLHPITVLLTLIFWTLLWGIPGAVISVPLTAVLKMVMERFETTQPVAEILAGRLPPVTHAPREDTSRPAR